MSSGLKIYDDAKRNRIVARIELVAAIVLSAAVLFCIIMRTVHAGALWRDECDSLGLATMPTFSDIVNHLQFTGFPILFPVTVRSYVGLFGSSDIALRCFGLLAGAFFLAMTWFEARSLNRTVPLLLPALIGLNANFLTAGLWLRGYGIACAFIVLAFTVTAKFLTEPSMLRLGAVFLIDLVGMHYLFFNGALIAAILASAIVVLLLRRDWKWAWMLLAAGAICGLSYLPYIWEIYSSTSKFAVIVQMSFSWSWAIQQFLSACSPSRTGVVLWLTIPVLCFIAGAWRLKAIWRTDRKCDRALLLFALLLIPAAFLAQFGFLRLMQNIIIPRYFLVLITLIAASSTVITSTFSAPAALRWGRGVVAVLALAILLFVSPKLLYERNSNIDAIAQQIEKDGHPNDLIALSDAQLGISFNHYYHGHIRWVTAPEIDDYRTHRYDLMMKKMTEFFPLDDVEKEIEKTLKSGNRVWIIGGSPVQSMPILAPAPDPVFGWQLPAYIISWSQQFFDFFRRHAAHGGPIRRREQNVSQWENEQLIECDGWKA